MSKKRLVKGIKEKCTVEIVTGDQVEDFMDVDLSIKFLDGALKDMKYELAIDLQDYRAVGW